MSGDQCTAETQRWGKPHNARRWHVFDGSRSLCGNWMYTSGMTPVSNEDSFNEGEDCKTCARKAGVLDESSTGTDRQGGESA